MQYAVYIAPLGAAGVEFTIAVGAGTTFAKTIITFSIYFTLLVHGGQVAAAAAYIFTPFEHNGFNAMLQTAHGSKQACGACAYNHHAFVGMANIVMLNVQCWPLLKRFVDVSLHLQVHPNGFAAGINRLAADIIPRNRRSLYTGFGSYQLGNALCIGSFLWKHLHVEELLHVLVLGSYPKKR